MTRERKAVVRWALAAVVLALLAAIDLSTPRPALAASFTVNSTNDAPDVSLDGVCETATAGECTLRAAIQESNVGFFPTTTITLPSGVYQLTIAGADEDLAATGDLDIWSSVSIVGAGASTTTIDAAGLDRVMDVASGGGGPVNLSGITIRGGFVGTDTDGGGIRNRSGTGSSLTLTNVIVSNNVTNWTGGGISNGTSNGGTLSINSSIITGNTQLGAGAYAMGGGGISILNGDVTITNSTISGNSAWQGGGIWTDVGTYVAGSLTISDSVIDGNSADWGGGIFVFDGDPNLSGSTISNNTAVAGGGIAVEDGALTITSSTITGNTQQGTGFNYMGGGGISVLGGDVTITNSTISGNTAWLGGGIWSDVGTYVAGSLTVNDSLIDANTAEFGGGVYFDEGNAEFSGTTIANNTAVGGGGIFGEGADLTLTNTTISGNGASEYGGGIAFCYCRLRNVTIAGNTADSDANGSGSGGGLALGDPAATNACCAELRNSIIAGNVDKGGEMPNVGCLGDSTLYFEDYNLIQDFNLRVPEMFEGCTVQGDTTGNIIGQPALLGPLTDNGGPTMTHALLPASPAVNAGNPAVPGSGGFACEATDQRGISRPQNARCDIGAFEQPLAVGGVARQPDTTALPAAASSRGSTPYAAVATLALVVAAAGALGWRMRRL